MAATAKSTESDTAEDQNRSVADSPSGVFVFVVHNNDGTAQVNFQGQGDVDPLSIPVLLEMASRVARSSLGLPNP